MTGSALVFIILSSFLMLIGLGLGVVWLFDQLMVLVKVVDDEWRRRLNAA